MTLAGVTARFGRGAGSGFVRAVATLMSVNAVAMIVPILAARRMTEVYGR